MNQPHPNKMPTICPCPRLSILRRTVVTKVLFVMATYYDTLHVDRAATTAKIQTAYKVLALSNHPDKTHELPDAERFTRQERFKAISHVYEVLSNNIKRTLYDKTLPAFYQSQHNRMNGFSPSGSWGCSSERSRPTRYNSRFSTEIPLSAGPYMRPGKEYPQFPPPYNTPHHYYVKLAGSTIQITPPLKFCNKPNTSLVAFHSKTFIGTVALTAKLEMSRVSKNGSLMKRKAVLFKMGEK